MSRELYVYSTETYLQRSLVKVGMCERGRHKSRIREQFGTSNPEQPLHLWVKDLPDGITDKKIHSQMEKNGINDLAYAKFDWSRILVIASCIFLMNMCLVGIEALEEEKAA